MNPPSALHSAMGRERKPFTYTPGGLDLSQIKSQRMAQRLMRNAMNQGVEPRSPPAPVHASPTTPIAVPNFNCLPVQVFPTMQLPSNPKSLLRTRSHQPESKMPSFLNSKSNTVNSPPVENKPVFTYTNNLFNNNNNNFTRTQSMNEYENIKPNNPFEINLRTGADGDKNIFPLNNLNSNDCFQISKPEESFVLQKEEEPKYYDNNKPLVCDVVPAISAYNTSPTMNEENSNDEKDIRVVKKQATTTEKTTKTESQNGDTEAAVTVKLPPKSSAAKTETKVEVVKKTLPDGSLQEIKTTTTKTIVDGKTEIRTQTETKTIPKAQEAEEEEEEEETEEVEETNEEVLGEDSKTIIQQEIEEEIVSSDQNKTNGEKEEDKKDNVIVNEERSEKTTTTAKKVMFVENTTEILSNEEEEEIEEEIIENDEVIDVEQKLEKEIKKIEEDEPKEVKEDIEEEENYEETEKEVAETTEVVEVDQNKKEIEQEGTEKEEIKEVIKNVKEPEINSENDESEYTEEEYESEVEEAPQKSETVTNEEAEVKKVEEEKTSEESVEKTVERKTMSVVENSEDVNETAEKEKTTPLVEPEIKQEKVQEEKAEIEEQKAELIKVVEEDQTAKEQKVESSEIKEKQVVEKADDTEEKTTSCERRIPIREPSVPLEKVEDVEIKPLTGQDFVTRTHTEKTEIITSSNDKPTGTTSTQTEYNRVENIVTVNRSTKTLDRPFDNFSQPSTIPTLSSFFSQTRDISPSRQIPRQPQQPTYHSEPVTERRHSLLLERLSVERQLPVTEIYQNQYNTQISEHQRQWSEEPRSEVLIVGNVKPSAITKNQQWYQYSPKDNFSSSGAVPNASVPPSQQWTPQPQFQQQYPPKSPQPQFQPHPISKPFTQSDSYKSSYTENIQNNVRTSSNIFNSNVQQNNFSNYPSRLEYEPKPELAPKPDYTPKYEYAPKPDYATKSDWSSNVPTVSQTSNYSTQYTTNTDYQPAQSYPSSYVPPPWEQDSRYAADTTNQTQYQPPPASTFSPSFNQSWQPTQKPKFTKPPPTAYIPPAPNQSFVVPVTPTQPKVSGRKTYYSEYERRYISVPESNYVPTETKYQHQPDPSPVYYSNNEEPSETAEPEWRKELREFTEKSKTQTYTERTSTVRPPWEAESAKPPPATYTPTPTWSQTLRPRSYRENSYEAEFTGSQTQEWPKATTLGRGRPLSTYEKNEYEVPLQRVRGVSVDRYNPNNYQSPAPGEHPPVLSQTLTPENAPHKHHNPHAPAYRNSRASAEPRDHTATYRQPRMVDSRAPFQSRSFKYLQWITNTED